MSSKFTIFFRLCNRAFLPCRHPTGNLRRPSLAPYRSPSRTSAGILPGYALRSPSPPVPLHGIPAFSGPFHSPLPRYSRMIPARHRHTPLTAPGAHLRLQSATVHSTVLRPGTEIEIASCDGAVALRHSPWHRCINGRQRRLRLTRTFSALQRSRAPPDENPPYRLPWLPAHGKRHDDPPRKAEAHARTRTDYSSNTN